MLKIVLSNMSDNMRVEVATALLSEVIEDVVAGGRVVSLPPMIPAFAEAWGSAQ